MTERIANPAIVLLVDRRGHILLQHRDAHAPRFPNLWGFVGGAIEEGESSEEAARREVYEETGLTISEPLTPVQPFPWPNAGYRWYIFCAPTHACADDLILGEGQELRFVPPDDVFALDLHPAARAILTDFVYSLAYARAASDAAADELSHGKDR
jgi:8-oxo-dGTP diphosphatase